MEIRPLYIQFILALLIPLIAVRQTLALSPEVNDKLDTVSDAVAEPLGQCAKLLHTCFTDIALGDERMAENTAQAKSNCLFSASRHPFCDGTSLGNIANQRWLMSPSENSNAAAFLGPQMVNKECLTGFDSFFASVLLNDARETKDVASLKERLSNCSKDTTQEISR